jgi:hypothetical protein
MIHWLWQESNQIAASSQTTQDRSGKLQAIQKLKQQ